MSKSETGAGKKEREIEIERVMERGERQTQRGIGDYKETDTASGKLRRQTRENLAFSAKTARGRKVEASNMGKRTTF